MKKRFYVIAYDVADNKRRNRISRLLGRHGVRINFSIFECMLTPVELEKLMEAMIGKIDRKTDSVIYYPLCLDCYAKIIYQGKGPARPGRLVKVL